jgi:hypothetical protein
VVGYLALTAAVCKRSSSQKLKKKDLDIPCCGFSKGEVFCEVSVVRVSTIRIEGLNITYNIVYLGDSSVKLVI